MFIFHIFSSFSLITHHSGYQDISYPYWQNLTVPSFCKTTHIYIQSYTYTLASVFNTGISMWQERKKERKKLIQKIIFWSPIVLMSQKKTWCDWTPSSLSGVMEAIPFDCRIVLQYWVSHRSNKLSQFWCPACLKFLMFQKPICMFYWLLAIPKWNVLRYNTVFWLVLFSF